MTSGHEKETCISFPETGDGKCGALDEQLCFDGQITTGLFWASFLAEQLYANWVQWDDAFQQATFLGSLSISSIAATFTPTTVGNDLTFDSMLSAFSSALGIASNVLPDPGDVIIGVNTAVTTIQSMLDLFPSASSFTLPTESDLESYMSEMLITLANSTRSALSTLSAAVFENPGNASNNIPANLLEGPFTQPVPNYFHNVKTVELIDTGNFSALTTKLANTINMYLVGAALAASDYYVVKNCKNRSRRLQ